MKKISCYLIDDEKEALTRLESLMQKLEGIEIIGIATSPILAIDEIIKTKPDMVFTDVEMPRKTGFEVVEEIRANHFYPTFVFVTAYNQYAIDAIKKAAFDYLLKPVKLDELKQALERFRSESVNHKTIDLSKCKVCAGLSEREKEILLLIIQGHASKAIAEQLFITKATVDFHRKNILTKTNSCNFNELIRQIAGLNYKI